MGRRIEMRRLDRIADNERVTGLRYRSGCGDGCGAERQQRTTSDAHGFLPAAAARPW
jgi:hypothetical protein